MSSSTEPSRNHLANETSPYLLQHAGNPVDWHPWGEEALALAREHGKPILLSVGYSACHWCHVMAHESFEDQATAALMNTHFVNIKVDREERPDLDRVYQLAHQLLTQRPGGWPLTMFLTPDDLTPFFGGTYFPAAPRYGMPAFKDLLLRVVDFLSQHRDQVSQQNAALRAALARVESAPAPGGSAELSAVPLAAAREALEQAFDAAHGGFGAAPKFPHPTNLQRLLRHHAASALAGTPDLGALHIVRHTLERMARGGIHDHVGGGFCRYSVDERWVIPHFEKMLYDNGPLLGLYAAASRSAGEPFFARVAEGIGEWVMREMQAPEGGYYSSLDADSEGEEGRFYLWRREEVEAVLDPDERAVVSAVFGLERPANFEGRWHLHIVEPPEAVAARQGRDAAATRALVASSLAKLRAVRSARVHPGRDEKVLVSWNALMIAGMTRAAELLGRPDFAASAERSRDFVRERMWRAGRLLATCKDGHAHLAAYLDDYAFLLEALLGLLSRRWKREDLDWAVALAEILLEHFEDRDAGGFFFTADDHEALIHRSKPFTDDALPAGNGVACSSLLHLGHLLGEPRYLEAAERALRAAWPALAQAPHAHGAMLDALEDYLSPPQIVVLRARGEGAGRRWRERASAGPALRRRTVSIPADEAALPGLLAARRPLGEVTAYVCTGPRCDAPTTSFDSFAASLAEAEPAP